MADEKYRLQLEGDQIDDALMQMFLRAPEGWTQGTRDGVAVGSGSQYYHNNAKWFAEQAATSAARAEGAIPAGTAGAVFFDRDMSDILTARQKAVFRKNIMAGGSNRNLLMNPWFTVRQRGDGPFTGNNNYTADRWTFSNGNYSTITLGNDGLTWENTQANQTLRQRIPFGTVARGEQICISYIEDGVLYQGTLTLPQTFGTEWALLGSWSHTAKTTIQIFEGNGTATDFTIQFSVRNTSTRVIRAVKIEKGNYSTLANDAPPNYGEELAKCKYYYRELIIDSGTSLGVGWAYSNSGAVIPNIFGYGMQMRAKPSITFTGVFRLRTTSGTDIAVTSFSAGSDITAQSMDALVSSGLTANQPVRLQGSAGSRLKFSADL